LELIKELIVSLVKKIASLVRWELSSLETY